MVLLTSLIIIDAPLSGTIPANLGGLTDMQVFTLSNTSISGTLNAELGTLPGLLALKITNSPVSGTIPPSVNNLPSLSYLQFYANKMSGTLPVLDNIGKVGSVEKGFILTVGNNDVSGTIHASMFKTMVKATSIMLYNSQMSGSLPDSLYALSDLLNLQLGGNKLTGCVLRERCCDERALSVTAPSGIRQLHQLSPRLTLRPVPSSSHTLLM